MARFVNSFNKGLELGYGSTRSKDETAYEKYIREHYGPDVTSHRDPIALARAAADAVGGAVGTAARAGAGFFGHAASGLVGAPQGPSRAVSPRASSSQNVVYGGRGGGGAVGRMPSGAASPGAGLSSPGPASAAHEDFFRAISEAEGTTKYGYNTVYGGANGIGGRPLTNMTLREITNYQKGMIPRQGASPMGMFQINRKTLITHATKLGLNLDKTVFDEATQKRLALSIAEDQGIAPPTWDGFRKNAGAFARAKKAYAAIQGDTNYSPVASSASRDPQVAQLQEDLNNAGAGIAVDGIMGPQTRAAMNKYKDVASAYAPTGATTTPALQAAAQQASGTSTSSKYERSSEIAQIQRDLNSRGANLKVDGIRGPLTQAAEKQFLGSPTSVRTPSFTSTPTRTAITGSSYTSGRGDEGTNVRAVPVNSVVTPTVYSDAPYNRQLPSYTTTALSGPNVNQPGGRPVPTTTGYAPQTSRALTGGFTRTAPTTANQWSSLQGPYTNSTGGANAWSSLQQPYPAQAPVVQVPTARIPQARPDYQPPQQAVPATTAGMSLADLQAMAEKYGVPVGHIAQVASDIGNRAAGAYHESQRSGMGYSGGNYSGGSYGGAGGRSISSGVGGAYKNR